MLIRIKQDADLESIFTKLLPVCDFKFGLQQLPVPYKEFAIIDLYQNWQVGFLLLFLLEFFFFITITKKFNGFFSFNIPLMDPDPWGKLNADPDPQLCFKF